MKKTKILVTGFPHSGTSILKSKFGECSNLHEVPFETAFVRPEDIHYSGDKENILIKYQQMFLIQILIQKVFHCGNLE